MKWKDKELKTKGDYVDALPLIMTQREADEFMELARDENEDHADENIGYIIGYLGAEDQKRLYELCEVEHPIFGRRTDVSAKEAFAMGMAAARGAKGTDKVLLAINKAKLAISYAEDREHLAREEANTARHSMKTAMSEYSKIPVGSLQLGGWDCPGSPTGECYYDLRKPMGDDECEVCHGPDERK